MFHNRISEKKYFKNLSILLEESAQQGYIKEMDFLRGRNQQFEGKLHWGGTDNSSFKEINKKLYSRLFGEKFQILGEKTIEEKYDEYFDVVYGWCR